MPSNCVADAKGVAFVKDARETFARVEPEIRIMLANYLRAHFRLMSCEHEDIVQVAVENFYFYLESLDRELPFERSELDALALTFAKRRAIDYWRSPVSRYVRELSVKDWERVGGTDASAENVAHYRRLLVDELREIIEMQEEDQTLLLSSLDPTARSTPLSLNDRKRLSRLRKRLKESFGMSSRGNNLE